MVNNGQNIFNVVCERPPYKGIGSDDGTHVALPSDPPFSDIKLCRSLYKEHL